MIKTTKKQNIFISLLLIFFLSLSALIFFSLSPIRAFAAMNWSDNYFCFSGYSAWLDDEGADFFYFGYGYFEIAFESWDTFYEPYVELSGCDFVGWTEDYAFLYNLSTSLGLSYGVVDYASLASIDFYDFSDIFERPIDVQAVFVFSSWTATTYTVTLDKQGGFGGSDSVTATYGFAMPSATVPTKTGYTFDGYWTLETGGMQFYTGTMGSARIWTISMPIILYAHWTANTYTVTFDKQGGFGGNDSVTATYNSAMPSANVPIKTGYTFDGYWTTKTGGMQYYTDIMGSARIWTISMPITLYAHWMANTYTVIFDKQGGTGGIDSVTVTYGEDLENMNIAVPTWSGYGFMGYYTERNGGGMQYYSLWGWGCGSWDIANDITLYADWLLGGDTGTTIPPMLYEFFFEFLFVDPFNYVESFYSFSSYDSTAMAAINDIRNTTPIYEGYTFAGWVEISYGVEYNVADLPYFPLFDFDEVFTRDIVVCGVWLSNEPEPVDSVDPDGSELVDPSDSDSSESPAATNIFSLQNLSKAAGGLLLILLIAYVFKFFRRVKNKGRGSDSLNKKSKKRY
jgi:uncharacterized repeat protein (TIGR02543 family)